ncbi:hypothetical protein GCM10010302_44690 [Streptomyces polychromogenes]|uniref:Uncharacterized protein n=1 Tax=Streptomyces polychromogenes TaxID=67342 RepID=A0ABP3F476_9ACTN
MHTLRAVRVFLAGATVWAGLALLLAVVGRLERLCSAGDPFLAGVWFPVRTWRPEVVGRALFGAAKAR